MSGSWPIGRVAGIPVRVHWSFAILVVAVVALTAPGGGAVVLASLAWLVFLFASVVVHEFAHSLVARARGLSVRDIVLLPIGGMSEIPDLDRTPQDELRISLAGPLSSAALGLLLGAAALLTGASLWPPSLVGGAVLARMAWLNMLLAGFNLLPALPLDGGRVLRAALARRGDDLHATVLAARVAQVIAVALVAVGMLLDFWLALIGVFVLLGAVGERRSAELKAALAGRRVADLTIPLSVVLHAGATAGGTLAAVPQAGRYPLPAVDGTGYVGMVAPDRLTAAAPDSRVGDAADRSVPLLDPDTPLFPLVVEAFARSRAVVLPVGRVGSVTGMLRRADVEAAVRGAVPLAGRAA